MKPWLLVAMVGACGANRESHVQASQAVAQRRPLQPCVTKGSVRVQGGRLHVDEPAVRGVVPGTSGNQASLKFRYLGPTKEVSRLASSQQIREQVGLKLRARDGCNVLYVMWRLAPGPGLEVSLKRNPALRESSQCGSEGYQKLAAHAFAPVPTLAAGSEHTLAARLDGGVLVVHIDGVAVWRGDVGEAARLVGPMGFRTDNARVEFELGAEAPLSVSEQALPRCDR